ncbi:MAG TPA: flavoprotein [Actinospica sp.]|jgi:phosphopantothenoylcysteine synthetase/decarboxylase|nr:flavoprotein [Actinospica sp.]
MSRTLYVIVCGAGTAGDVGGLVGAAIEQGWDPYVVPTPSGADFIDAAELEKLTGHPIRSRYRKPGEASKLPHADAVIVAPATYNTINKWAFGASDTFALGLLAEMTGLGVPTAVLPFVNTALAANNVYNESLHRLEACGVTVLTDNVGNAPHAPGTGDRARSQFPWAAALDAVKRA